MLQHLQRDIVRAVEGYIVTGAKQVEIGELVMELQNFMLHSKPCPASKFIFSATSSNRYQVVR